MAKNMFPLVVRALRRHLIWCLVGAYALAMVWPGPGNALRNVGLGVMPFSGMPINPTHLLLATLLFCVGRSLDAGAVREQGEAWKGLLVLLGGTWLIPIAVLVLFRLLPQAYLERSLSEAFLLGAALTISMPPANSASVWTDLSGGAASKTVSLIVLGTVSCPVVTPLVLQVFTPETAAGLVDSKALIGSLEVLIAFVVLPVSFGMLTRRQWEMSDAEAEDDSLFPRGVSLAALLLLNYSNGAAALPYLWESSEWGRWVLPLLSVMLCSTIFLVTLGMAVLRKRSWQQEVPFLYSTGMRNTGAALVLTVSFFPDQPEVALVPVFYTMAQHMAAALIDRCLITPRGANHCRAAAESPPLPDSTDRMEAVCRGE